MLEDPKETPKDTEEEEDEAEDRDAAALGLLCVDWRYLYFGNLMQKDFTLVPDSFYTLIVPPPLLRPPLSTSTSTSTSAVLQDLLA